MKGDFAQLKRSFFDRAAVMRQVDAGTRKVFSRFGSHVRTTAKRSIRPRKGPSKPGNPPHSHEGSLRKLIFFSYDKKAKSVVVGPLPLGAVGIVPPVLEEGGTTASRKNGRRRERKVGTVGEIRIGGRKSRASSYVLDKAGKRQRVTFARLKTPDQARRANELNAELYGPAKLPRFEIEARPFMGPAFEQEKATLPAAFAGAF